MIKSKFSFYTLASFIITPILTLVIGALLYDNFSGYLLNTYPITKQTSNGSHQILLLGLLMVVFLFSVFSTIIVYRTVQYIFIDPIERTITFKKVFGDRNKIIKYNEIEGYYDSVQNTRSGFYKLLLIISSGYVVGTISSIKYSNFRLLEEAIEDLKYLGRKQYSFKERIMLFKN